MRRIQVLLLTIPLIALALPMAILADEPASTVEDRTATRPSTPEQAVGGVLEELAARINRGDGPAIAELWAPEATYLGPRGERVVGREAIGEGFQRLLRERPGMRVEVELLSVRLLGEDVALVEVTPHTRPRVDDLPGELRASVVLRRHDGEWLIERLDDLLIYRPSNANKMHPLAWLVGDWFARGPDGHLVLLSHCEWTADGNALKRTFTARPPGKPPVTGTQLIGWDPRGGGIRSWLFDSNGGVSEAEWRREEDRWIIETEGALHDGREVRSTNTLTREGDDRFTLMSTDRHVAGERQPDIGPLEVRRAVSPSAQESDPTGDAEDPGQPSPGPNRDGLPEMD